MEWLILCLLVPAIVVPVVLLWGFVGCHLVFQAEPDLLPPQNLVATPSSVSEITLTWDNPEPSPVRFQIHRAKGGGAYEPIARVVNPIFVDPTMFEPLEPLEPGITYHYQVFAIGADDPLNRSPASIEAKARPLAFAANLSVPTQGPPDTYTYVQRISAARLHNHGEKVRLTVQGLPAGNVIINRIYLSRVAPSGDPYDSLVAPPNEGGLTKIIDSALLLTDANPVTLAWVDYTLFQTEDLLVTIDFTALAGQDTVLFDPAAGVRLYFKTGVQQAGKPDGNRDAGYTLTPDPRNYLVTKIEVLGNGD